MNPSDFIAGITAAFTGAWEVRAVLKGGSGGGARILAAGTKGAGPLILTRATESTPWRSQGRAGAYLAGFVSMVLQLPERLPGTDGEWAARLAQSRPYLGHPDPRLGRSAWAEWARAPYRVLRRERIDAKQLRTWLADSSLDYGRSLWTALLGLSTDPNDVQMLQQSLEAAWRTHDDTTLAALLTAGIERRGADGVRWLEERYFRKGDRALEEIEAAVAALSVGAETHETLRPRILAACRTLIDQRPLFSGLVANDLARWQDWSAAESFRAILASGTPVLIETRPQIDAYLEACRRAGAERTDSR